MELKTYFAQDAAGNIISSAIVNVFLQGTTTLASGLTRADGTPLENPFAADGAGRIQFRAPDGYYDVQVSAGPGIIQTLTIQCVDYSAAKADADRADAAADRADVSAEQAQNAINSITGINTNFEQNSREQWRRSLAEAGLTLVSGSFEEGATVNSSTDAVWHIAGGQCYYWEGALPKTIPASSSPASTGGVADDAWRSVGDVTSNSTRAFANVDAMLAFNWLRVGEQYSTGGTTWEMVSKSDPVVIGDFKPLNIINVKDFGVVGDGVADDTAQIHALAATGSPMFFPDGTYRVSEFPGITSVYMYGSHYSSVEIITTGDVVFPDATIGEVRGIKFRSQNVDSTTLFGNPLNKLLGYFESCYFQDYAYAFNYTNYGDSLRVHECYFRNGLHGIYLNYAHNVHVTNCIFWQQKSSSLSLLRGTGSNISGCNFVGTNDKPARVYLFAQQCLFESNYMEFYGTGGNIQDHWIQVEVTNYGLIPTIRNNQINGDNSVNHGVVYTFSGTSMNDYVMSNYENQFLGLSISDIEIEQIDKFKNINIHDNTSESTAVNFPRLRYYRSEVTGIDTTTPSTNVLVPIDSGIVYDPFRLSSGENTIKAYIDNVKFKITVTGSYSASSDDNGIIIKVRDVNGSKLKQLVTSCPIAGEVPISYSFIIDQSESNSAYRIDWTKATGLSLPDTMDLVVELEEITTE